MTRLKTLPSRLRPPAQRLKALPALDRQTTRLLHTGSAAWARLREQVLTRDGNRCQACGRLVVGKRAHVDHMNGDSHCNDLSNLQTLCHEGHSRKTTAEQAGMDWDLKCRT